MKTFLTLFLLLVLIAGGTLAFASCSSNSSTITTRQSNNQDRSPSGSATDISIENFSFNPATLTVTIGAIVKWTNKDSATHTVVSDTGIFSSQDIFKGGNFSYTFSVKGTFAYHCGPHPSMKATITVQ
jgi:plastocyanin